MRTRAIRTIGFDAGHRVVSHESKCRTFHGHRYKAEIYAEADNLDDLGRIIDFGVIKDRIGGWIDENWDHAMVIWSQDPDRCHIEACEGYKEPFVMNTNPTAENMAAYLLGVVCPRELNSSGVVVTKIRLWETPNCYVEVDANEEV